MQTSVYNHTIVCLNIYNDIDFIKDCLESIRWADKIIIVDGAYKDFPHTNPRSDDGTIEACLAFEHKSLQLITAEKAWDSEIIKRNTYLENIIPDDYTYCMVIDGDEIFEGELPYLSEDIYHINQIRGDLPIAPITMRIFRAMPNLRYEGAHNALWQQDKFLNAEEWPIVPGCHIRHLTDHRKNERVMAKGVYMRKLKVLEHDFRNVYKI